MVNFCFRVGGGINAGFGMSNVADGLFSFSFFSPHCLGGHTALTSKRWWWCDEQIGTQEPPKYYRKREKTLHCWPARSPTAGHRRKRLWFLVQLSKLCLDCWVIVRVVGICTEQQSRALSPGGGGTPQLSLLFIIVKYQSRWVVCCFKCKSSIPYKSPAAQSPPKVKSSFVRIFPKYTTIQEAKGEEGKDTNIASPLWEQYCAIVNIKFLILTDHLIFPNSLKSFWREKCRFS